MKTKIILPILFLVAALMQSCVSNKKYAELQNNYNALQTKQNELKQSYDVSQRELEGSRSRVKSLEEQIASEKANRAALQDALNKCLAGNNQGNVNIAKLADQITASDQYIKELIAAKSKSDFWHHWHAEKSSIQSLAVPTVICTASPIPIVGTLGLQPLLV